MDNFLQFFAGIWQAIVAFFKGIWATLRGLSGFDNLAKHKRATIAERSTFYKLLYYGWPLIAVVVIIYNATIIYRFSHINGDELQYPQVVLAEAPHSVAPGAPMNDGSGKCARSDIVAMTAYILDVLVNQNTWVPGDPFYKIGWFGIKSFDSGPLLDNKASFQRGAMRAVRRISIEMVDLLGRARGTSAADEDLQAARGAVQWNESAWIFNPFDSRNPLLSVSAAESYRSSIRHMTTYNERLAACDALFDPRSDNLFQLLDRIANDVGGLTDQLSQRARADQWDVRSKTFVPASGNNRGIFDFRADNLFYEAHGAMWAYHGILQAARVDFGQVVQQSNLDQIWDRMESHVAESASLEPLIVSNGAEDSLFFPAHLSAMAVNMLRARANMTELREILNR
jgi:hypothetical protein